MCVCVCVCVCVCACVCACVIVCISVRNSVPLVWDDVVNRLVYSNGVKLMGKWLLW